MEVTKRDAHANNLIPLNIWIDVFWIGAAFMVIQSWLTPPAKTWCFAIGVILMALTWTALMEGRYQWIPNRWLRLEELCTSGQYSTEPLNTDVNGNFRALVSLNGSSRVFLICQKQPIPMWFTIAAPSGRPLIYVKSRESGQELMYCEWLVGYGYSNQTTSAIKPTV